MLNLLLHNRVVPYIIVFVYGVALYLPTITYEFALDDKISIINNQFTKKGIAGIPDIVTHDYFYGFFGEEKNLLVGGRYRPLSLVFFAILWEFFKDNPMPYHLFNVLFYGVTGIILLYLLSMLFRDFEEGRPWFQKMSFLATVVYLSHPIHVEVVANVKSLDEILSFLFAIVSHIMVLKGYHIQAGIMFFLSLTAKESSITYVPAIGVSYYLFYKRDIKESIRVMISPVISFVIYVILRISLLGMPSVNPVKELLNDPYLGATSEQKFATISYVMLLYIKLLFFPHPLTHDYYPFHIKWTTWSNPLSILSLVIHGIMIGYVINGIRRRDANPIVLYAMIVYLTGMSIYTNILFSIGSFMNERFAYIASSGYAIFITYLLFHRKIQRKISWLLFGIMVAGYTYKTYERSPVWRNDETLSLTDVKISTGSAKVNMSAGLSCLKLGRNVVDTVECCKLYVRPHVPCPKIVIGKDTTDCCVLLGADTSQCPVILKQDSIRRHYWFVQARNYAMKSLSIYPTYSHAMVVAGNAYFELNDLDSAIYWFIRCVEVNPGFNDCIRNLEVTADKARDKGLYQLADKGYTALLKVKKDDAGLYAKAGELAGRYLGDLNRAYILIQQGLKIDSNHTDLMTKMGVVYGLTGKYDSALYYFRKVASKNPNDANNLLNIGVTYQHLGYRDSANYYINLACSMNPSLCHQQARK